MTAHDDVHIPGVPRKDRIDESPSCEAYVCKGDHQIAAQFFFQIRGPFVDHLGIVETPDADGDRLGDQSRQVRRESDDSDLHPGPPEHRIRTDIFTELGRREVIVGADYRTLERGKPARKFRNPVVELMVAQGDTVVFHSIQNRYLDVPMQSREI